MSRHFQTLLEAIAANPQQPVAELPLLTKAERDQLLVEWNDTQVDYPKDKCLHQLFEEQVEKTPDAVAVVFEDQQLTYREINARANQLAHYLKSLGVKPETLVGICVERSVEMVVGLLGILKAGGAYVPLDPNYPQERLSYMLEDSQLPILLTQQNLLKKLPQRKTQTICMDEDWQNFADHSQDNPYREVKSDNLAYIIYTSGSTGKPKGTMILHSGMVNYLSWCTKTYNVANGEGSTVNSSLGFDATITSLFSPLLVGKMVVLLSEEGEIEALKTALCSNTKFSLVKITPAHLEILNHLLDEEQVNIQTQAFIIGGEALSEKVTSFWKKSAPATRLINEYGPTETVVGCCTYEVGKPSFPRGNIPIGRPIANTQLFILDKHLQVVPIGVTGELYIGGDGLARGYLNCPELTQEKFISNPFLNSKSERLYKTGDLVRYLSDGNIEYLGRIDHQVKIRGFRIELGEIEAALSQHHAVREAVVLAQERLQEGKHLVAYIVIEKQQSVSNSELRRFLKEKLPEYMVPSVFIKLEALPLTPNGKVDCKALLAPATARPELEKAFVAPSTPVETKLVEIWSQVLGLKQVGIYDNFFELGGDSIISIQVVARANQAGLQLTPKQLFKHQNIAELAAVAITKKSPLAEQGLVTGQVSLTPIQKWFFEQNLSEPHHFNQAVLLQVQQQVDLALLEQALQQLLLHHDALRLKFEPTESGWQQFHQSSTDVSLQLSHWDFSGLTEVEQNQAIETTANELQASLNLSSGTLLRVGFFDLGASQPSRLLIVIHHLVVDGVSWRILLEDLQTAYEQLSQGVPVALPAKTTSFQQWSQKLREYGRSTTLKQEFDYWQAQLPKPSKPLPVDFAGGDNTIASVKHVSSHLSSQETQVLLQQVPQIYHTQINDVLLTALVQTFIQWTGETALLVDLEGHGREDLIDEDEVDVSRTVGWFTAIFPVLLNLGDTFDPGDALKKVKEELRSIPHRGIGYGVLRYLSDEPKVTQHLRTLPQAQVIFNYLGQFDQSISPSSLFAFAQESSGLAHSLKGRRSHLLEINGMVSQGQLQLTWSYSQKLHARTTIEKLAEDYIEALRTLIAHCQSPDAGGFTPSDFADFQQSQWSQTDLDAITAAIGDI
jgi:amino acid adenylation domain-containing protein/non-ribosomal peptide synthase protein (TIGR01720 family)